MAKIRIKDFTNAKAFVLQSNQSGDIANLYYEKATKKFIFKIAKRLRKKLKKHLKKSK